jgi:hypothetical protein
MWHGLASRPPSAAGEADRAERRLPALNPKGWRHASSAAARVSLLPSRDPGRPWLPRPASLGGPHGITVTRSGSWTWNRGWHQRDLR